MNTPTLLQKPKKIYHLETARVKKLTKRYIGQGMSPVDAKAKAREFLIKEADSK